jgi:hypothetical protein
MNTEAYDALVKLRRSLIDELKNKFEQVNEEAYQKYLTFSLFDDEYLVKSHVNAFTKSGTFRLYHLIDDIENYGKKKLVLIPELNVRLALISLNGGTEAAAYIGSQDLAHTTKDAARFASQYHQALIDHLSQQV